MAAIAGAVAHNLFDSDLYVPANAITLGAVCGLTLARARFTLTPHPPDPLRPAALGLRPSRERGSRLFTRYLSVSAAVLLIAFALLVAGGRMEAYDAAIALNAGDGAAAVNGYQEAAALDGWNPEYHLSLASLYERSNQPEKARSEYEEAMRVAPIGKVFYRYGRFLTQTGHAEEAVRMHERTRAIEPHNLQNLLALADAYKVSGRLPDAESLYAGMIRLYRSPFGAVRAVPELVDWEFGMAYLGLAEAALARGDKVNAEANLREGAGILGEFWRSRHLEIFQIRVRPDVLHTVALRYDWSLEQWAKTLKALGRPKEAATIEERRAQFRAEMEKEFNAPPSS